MPKSAGFNVEAGGSLTLDGSTVNENRAGGWHGGGDGVGIWSAGRLTDCDHVRFTELPVVVLRFHWWLYFALTLPMPKFSPPPASAVSAEPCVLEVWAPSDSE